jgi:hypothetical protein
MHGHNGPEELPNPAGWEGIRAPCGQETSGRETEREAVLMVAERLKAAYAGRCAPEEIDTAVATAYAALRDRPVLAFIPVLVERRVRRMLKGPTG